MLSDMKKIHLICTVKNIKCISSKDIPFNQKTPDGTGNHPGLMQGLPIKG